MPVNFLTCSYTEFRPNMGVAVRASVGAPRWKLKYDIGGVMPMVMPTRPMLKLDQPTYRERFMDILNSHGVDLIATAGQAIVDRQGDHRLVLLCFERLAEGSWCHRRMFAEWWLEQTGEEVPELGAMPQSMLI